MDNFNRRMISNVRVTEEGALRGHILKRKRKQEIASAATAVDKVDRIRIQSALDSSEKEAARIVSSIVSPGSDTDRVVDPNLSEQVDVLQDVRLPRMFLLLERHSSTTPEDLSERWGLSLAQATLTLKATTQKLVRSALMPLARRYWADRMFDVPRVHGMMSTDTMDARCKSIHEEQYLQVFGNKKFFVKAYPIKKKLDCHEGLDEFIRTYGAMEKLVYDGAPEQIGRKSNFQAVMRKYDIKGRVAEKGHSNQNPVEGCIRELRRRWCCTMFRTY
jgi:hypothetical protein